MPNRNSFWTEFIDFFFFNGCQHHIRLPRHLVICNISTSLCCFQHPYNAICQRWRLWKWFRDGTCSLFFTRPKKAHDSLVDSWKMPAPGCQLILCWHAVIKHSNTCFGQNFGRSPRLSCNSGSLEIQSIKSSVNALELRVIHMAFQGGCPKRGTSQCSNWPWLPLSTCLLAFVYSCQEVVMFCEMSSPSNISGPPSSQKGKYFGW